MIIEIFLYSCILLKAKTLIEIVKIKFDISKLIDIIPDIGSSLNSDEIYSPDFQKYILYLGNIINNDNEINYQNDDYHKNILIYMLLLITTYIKLL